MGSDVGFSLAAPSKVNLYLNVLERRPDGYHEIDTVMQTVDLVDTLSFRRRPEGGVTLSVSGRTDGVPAGNGNLVLRAAGLLQRHTETEAGAEIRLEKRIPSGAGLGGASSDAAATLVGLARLWGLSATEDELLALAADLGSDVPFFIRGGAARCTGRGEKVRRLRSEGKLHLVLVFSGFLSTAEIYGLWDRSDLTIRRQYGKLPFKVDPTLDLNAVARSRLCNSLEGAAFEALPDLRELKQALLDAGALAAGVSGSGSCVFGLADSAEGAGRIAEALAGRGALAVGSVGPRELR